MEQVDTRNQVSAMNELLRLESASKPAKTKQAKA
jgi:hypothetical protein